ncbi:hypothetical protein GCM10023149_34000 [Mucilaginibacter gynuensis]|uniref:DUF6268 domain-containing protein n=1 Tax=Mucilaginibacter gynuensis TaxID=1302236 RepID=A0ABP8GSM2_9SPHI
MGLFFPLLASAQGQNDTLDTIQKQTPQNRSAEFTDRPFLKVDYKQFGNYNFTPALKDQNDQQDGKITNWSVLSIGTNIDLVNKRRWQLQATGMYRYLSVEEDFSLRQGVNSLESFQGDHHYHTEGLTFNYFSRLFGITAVYSTSVFLDGGDKSIERVRGMASGILVLKADEKTRMSVGLLATADPAALVPVMPIFLYNNKLSSRTTLDLMLPRYAYLRTGISKNGRLSAGFDFDQQTFFLHDFNGTNKTYQYSQVDANAGLVYEHLLPAHLMLTMSAGYRAAPFVRIFEKDRTFSDYTWSVKADPAPYASVGISFNPFSKGK